jgi:hypothetical protein
VIEIHGIQFPFTRTSGARTWPSSDPADSPFDKIRCERCGWVGEYRAHGSFPAGHDPEETIRQAIVFHADRCNQATGGT